MDNLPQKSDIVIVWHYGAGVVLWRNPKTKEVKVELKVSKRHISCYPSDFLEHS